MKIKQFGHLAFHCRDLQKSIEFYRDVLGCTEKFTLTYGGVYNELMNRKEKGDKIPKFILQWAWKRKDKIWLTYMEFADGVFVELFDQLGSFIPHKAKHVHYNYQHFALIVDDIYAAKKELVEKGVPLDTDITMGQEHTYQMWTHDPDGNKFEIMQYTERSFQVVGNHEAGNS